MTTKSKYLIKTAIKTQNVNKKLSQTINAVGGFEIIDIRDSRKPDLSIYELGENFEKDMAVIQSLLAEGQMKEVFLTAASEDPRILMQAMRIGVKEFISQPISENEVRQALEGFRKRQSESVKCLPHKNGKIISIFGSKGGVGATTVAVNLAVSMAQNDADCSVTLLDMNTLFGEIPFVSGNLTQVPLGGNYQEHREAGQHLFVKHSHRPPERHKAFAFAGLSERPCAADTGDHDTALKPHEANV